jgi:hypothetical protein
MSNEQKKTNLIKIFLTWFFVGLVLSNLIDNRNRIIELEQKITVLEKQECESVLRNRTELLQRLDTYNKLHKFARKCLDE